MEITYVGDKQEENVQSLKIYYNHSRIWGILFPFRVVFIGRKQIEYSKINNIFNSLENLRNFVFNDVNQWGLIILTNFPS